MLPNLIYAGAPKAGSSTLCAMLAQHPDVFIPKGNKEVFFFDFNYHKGIQWYEQFFQGAKNNQCIIDATVWYMRMENVPERVAQTLPGVKLLFVLRDPVKRAWSNLWHDYTGLFHLNEDFETLLFSGRDPRGVVMAGFYYKLIKKWKQKNPQSQIKIILFEEFLNQPEKVWAELCEFAEVKRIPMPPLKKEMAAKGLNNLSAYRALEKIHRFQPTIAKKISIICRRHPKVMNILFSHKKPPLKITPKIEERLKKIYLKDAEMFCSEIYPNARKYWATYK